MRKTVVDHCPDATPGRQRYYYARIDRALGCFAARLSAVTVHVHHEPAGAEIAFAVTVRLDLTDGSWRFFAASRSDLPSAVGAAFDAARGSLRDDPIPDDVVVKTGGPDRVTLRA